MSFARVQFSSLHIQNHVFRSECVPTSCVQLADAGKRMLERGFNPTSFHQNPSLNPSFSQASMCYTKNVLYKKQKSNRVILPLTQQQDKAQSCHLRNFLMCVSPASSTTPNFKPYFIPKYNQFLLFAIVMLWKVIVNTE